MFSLYYYNNNNIYMLFTQQNKKNANIEIKGTPLIKPNNDMGIFSMNLNKEAIYDKRKNILSSIKAVNGLLPANTEPVPHKKEMTWGRATWFLFHSLAEKVKEEYFLVVKKELCNNIYKICAGLPCELCRSHAIEYMRNINFDNIQTKTDFKRMLFNFHNVVNKNKNYEIYKYENLDEQYKKSNLLKIINNFFHYQNISRNKNSPSLVMYNNSLLQQLNLWFRDNLQYFNQ